MSRANGVRALEACAAYDHWAREVARLSEAITRTACRKTLYVGPDDWGNPEADLANISCFATAAVRTVEEFAPDYGTVKRRIWLEEIAPLVADCPDCRELVELIRARRHARKHFGIAKRQVRSAAKFASRSPAVETAE